MDGRPALRHSLAMRWLLLINLLAVVLLSGAVAIVLEGTPLSGSVSGGNVPPALKPEGSVALRDEQLDAHAQVPAKTQDTQSEGARGGAISMPVPLAPRRAVTSATGHGDEAPGALRQLRIATEGDFAPFNFQDARGQPAGFDIDIATELCARLGAECTYEVRSWHMLQPALLDREVDILVSSLQIPDTSTQGIGFSSPYYGSQGRFVVLSKAARQADGDFPAPGAQIAVQQGTVHAAYLAQTHPEVERITTQTFDEALSMVEAGKADGAFGDNATALGWLKQKPCCRAYGIPASDLTFFGRGIGIAVRGNENALLAAINQALAQMVVDGTHARLSQRYFADSIY